MSLVLDQSKKVYPFIENRLMPISHSITTDYALKPQGQLQASDMPKMYSFGSIVDERLKFKPKKIKPLAKLKSNIKYIKEYCKREDQDWLFLICGGEGSGKSTLALQIALMLNKNFNVHDQLVYNFNEDKYSYLQYLAKFKDEQFKAVIFDEAITSLFSRSSSNKESKQIIKIFNMNRALNHFSILVVPSFWSMDIDIRQRRARSLLYVYQNKDNYKRYYAYYSREKIVNISSDDYLRKCFLSPKLFMNRIHPDFLESFDKLEGDKINGKVWKDYVRMKMSYLTRTIDEVGMGK